MGNSLKDPGLLAEGVRHVSRDPKIELLVRSTGPQKFKPQGDVFHSLVESILSQQLNGRSADAIIGRVNALFDEGRATPEELMTIPARSLRKAGVSPQKVSYLRDLASAVTKGRVDLKGLGNSDDEEIIEMLDGVKGIGRWTAQMVLIFTLGRPDVLPVDDFGIQKAVQKVYGLRKLPRPARMEALAKPWHPFSTVACLYLWRHKDNGLKPS